MNLIKKIQQRKSCIRLLAAFLLLAGMAADAQKTYDRQQSTLILNKISQKLQSIRYISYQYRRETMYKDDNYHNIFETQVYFDFSGAEKNTYPRFQADNDKYFSCYNGANYFALNKINQTIALTEKPGDDLFESLSPLYNSWITLRNLLPIICTDESISRTIKDSIINSEQCYLVHFELYNQYAGNLGTLKKFTADYSGDRTKPYEIVFSRNTLLPLQYISKFKERKADFIAASFRHINTAPAMPLPGSWLASSYRDKYATAEAEKKLISTGTVPDDWTLPVCNSSNKGNVSLYQFRGKMVMLDFWIKSCGPCLASFPHLDTLQQKFGPADFQLLSVNTDDSRKEIEFFRKKYKPSYPMLYHAAGLKEKYGISSFPTIILLDKNGRIIYAGGFEQAVIEKIIKENL